MTFNIYALSNAPMLRVRMEIPMHHLHLAENLSALRKENFRLKGDDYFTSLEFWYEKLTLATNPPRDIKTVFADALQSLDNPVFSSLFSDEEYMKIKQILLKRGETL